MAVSDDRGPQTPLHARVLAWFEEHGVAPAEDVAVALDVPVAVVEAALRRAGSGRAHRAGAVANMTDALCNTYVDALPPSWVRAIQRPSPL